MRLIRILFVAAVGLTSLSACVGTDPQARLRAGAGTSFASAGPPMPEAVEPAQRLTAVMPGELLFEPGRGGGGINPQAVLTRTNNRVADASAPPRRMVAHAAHLSKAPVSAATADSGAVPQTSPFLAARLGPTDAPTGTPPAVRSTMMPLADVEAHAEVEQRAQANRDRRFDAQVRRASSSVCSGCFPAAGRRPSRAKPSADAMDD